MDIGRTIRVFRAEPVVGTVPEAVVEERAQEPEGDAVDAPPTVRVDADGVRAG